MAIKHRKKRGWKPSWKARGDKAPPPLNKQQLPTVTAYTDAAQTFTRGQTINNGTNAEASLVCQHDGTPVFQVEHEGSANFLGNAVSRLVMEQGTSDPGTNLAEGRLYWRTDTAKLRVYAGSAWADAGGGGDGTLGVDIQTYGFVDNSETTIAFNDSTYEFSLTRTGASFRYYRTGVLYTISADKTVTLSGTPPAANTYYIYIDATDGTLTASTTTWSLTSGTKVPVAVIQWNNGNTPKYLLADERHTCTILRREHAYLHLTVGTRLESGGAVGDYTVAPVTPTNDDNTFSITETNIWDEDIKHTLAALTDPGGTGTEYVVAYPSGGSWTWVQSGVPFKSGTYIQYNNAGTMADLISARWCNWYLLATNNSGDNRFIMIPGKSQFTSLNSAQAEKISDLNFTGFPVAEAVALYQFTFYSNTSYTNTGKCRLAAIPVKVSTAITTASSVPGLGTMAMQNADNVDITGGSISVGSLTDTGLTSGRVVVAGTGGLLGDSANYTYSGGTLTVSNGAAAVSILIVKDDTTGVFQVQDGGSVYHGSGGSPAAVRYRLDNGSSSISAGSSTLHVTSAHATSDVTERGIYFDIYTKSGSTGDKVGTQHLLRAGYTSTGMTVSNYAYNSVAGTGTNWQFSNGAIPPSANIGDAGVAASVTSGYNVGVCGVGGYSTALNLGVFGKATYGAGTTCLGVWGAAHTGTSANVGGLFTLGNVAPTLGTVHAALLADNVGVAQSIFIARDNGTTKFEIADGGAVTCSPSISVTSADVGVSPLTVTANGSVALSVNGYGTTQVRTIPTGRVVCSATNGGLVSSLNFTFDVSGSPCVLTLGADSKTFFSQTVAEITASNPAAQALTASIGNVVSNYSFRRDTLTVDTTTSTTARYGHRLSISGTYTNTGSIIGSLNEVSVAGTGNSIPNWEGNTGFLASLTASATLNVGVHGDVRGGTQGIGVLGRGAASGSGTYIGVQGQGYSGSGVQIGGLFTSGNTLPSSFTSAALVADNMGETSPIFLARDNSSTVFSIKDGGVKDHYYKANENFTLQTSAPGSPVAGTMYYDSANARLYIYTGAAWKYVDVNT